MDPLVELIAKNAIFEKADKKTINIRTKNSASIFSMNKLTQGLSIVFFLIIISLKILPAFDPSTINVFGFWILAPSPLALDIALAVIFFFVCTPLFLYQVVSKVYIYPDRIEQRNLLGFKKSMDWHEIKAAYFSSYRGALRLFGDTKNIKIGPVFNGFYYIVTAVSENCSQAFNIVSDLEPNRNYKEFKTKEGTAVFGLKKLRAVIGLFLLLLSTAGILIFNPSLPTITVIILCGVSGIFLLLSFVVSRVYIDKEKIAYRGISGEIKSLRWIDVRSAQLPVYSADSKIILKDGFNTIKFGSRFSGFKAMQYIIAKRCKSTLNK